MKKVGKNLILFWVIFFLMGGTFSKGWTQEKTQEEPLPMNDGKAFIDIAIARPIGFAVGLVGAGVFIVTLPFTLPTRSADEAARFLILDPFRFSFGRKFPDEHLK